VIRELADYDPRRYDEVLRYSMAEGLQAFEHRLKEQVRHEYELQLLCWAILAQSGASKQRPPEVPDLLKE
jgi:hypothetical protein